MTYLGPKVLGNFKPPKDPNKRRRERAADKRPGMDDQHRANVAKLPSCLSGRRGCHPHHLRIKHERGTGMKATDRWCVPLTPEEHDECHRVGSRREALWFKERGIENVYDLANALWQNRHSVEAMERVIAANMPKGVSTHG